jgi:hypothetical protein
LVPFLIVLFAAAGHAAEPLPPLRPPAVPLVTHDPYFSCWSFADALNGDWPRHWTGAIHGMCALARVDGQTFVLAGSPRIRGAKPMTQKSVTVLPTRTIYRFEGGGVAITLTFLTPALPHDLDLLALPATYATFDVASADAAAPHDVSLYLDVTGEWAVDKVNQPVTWGREPAVGDKVSALHVGTKDQPVLKRKGDNLRIEWGRLYLASATGPANRDVAGDVEAARAAFADRGQLPAQDEPAASRPASDRWPGLSAAFALGPIAPNVPGGVPVKPVRRTAVIAYDDEFAIEHMGKHLRPWWRRDGTGAAEMIAAAVRDHDAIEARCVAFDEQLMADLTNAGGPRYAALAALSFRQCLAAHKLVAGGPDGRTPLSFSKENFSNGCIATVDVTYPSSPFFLLFSPTLLKGQLTPILDYAAGDRWKFPFAPHDLGTYPQANGQVYGGGEKTEQNQMPVEESGNMLIMLAALAHVEGNADYARAYWPTLQKWAAYLKEKGLDPENQLCTDDFAGHLAHNTNLSLKAIVALAGYAKMADTLGHADEGRIYRTAAKEMATKWQQMAADGDHYGLTFDKPGTWSQKYNLVWDRLLRYDLFPRDVAAKEVAFYLTKQNTFGLPLDSRKAYTKLDWLVWTATMAEREQDFRALVAPTYDWMNQTTSRVPLTDWYDTATGKQSGFQARSVVGGVFIKMLADDATWKKYAMAKP